MPDSRPRCIVIGGGGHARVVLDALWASDAAVPYAVVDPASALAGTKVLGVPVRGGDDILPALRDEGATHFIVGLGGVGDNQPRRRLFELGVSYGLIPLTVCHPTAACSRWAELGAGCFIGPNATVNVGARLGVNVIVNSAAVVEHDDRIGDHVHIATGARLTSSVTVGAGAHIGAGAVVRQSLAIGEGAVVGAGAVVTRDVPAWTTVVGVPARAHRPVPASVGREAAGDRR